MYIIAFLTLLAACSPLITQIETDVIQGELQVGEKVIEDIIGPSKPEVTVIKKSF